VSDQVVIRKASADDAADLANVLVDTVVGGASVGFMLPFGVERAAAFWSIALDSASRGERIILVAEDATSGRVVGTVQVILTAPENQPHRGEISKMLVHREARGRGIAEQLMRSVETSAREAGKTLLVLDTASGTAERVYERVGWQRVGVVPDYALWPGGGLVDTVIFYKNLAE
jgi:ribosomal protein S18 acetylase RimI-like enzyme